MSKNFEEEMKRFKKQFGQGEWKYTTTTKF